MTKSEKIALLTKEGITMTGSETVAELDNLIKDNGITVEAVASAGMGVGSAIVGKIVARVKSVFINSKTTFVQQKIVANRSFEDKNGEAMFTATTKEGQPIIEYFGTLKTAYDKAGIKLPFTVNNQLNVAVEYKCNKGEVTAH